MPSFNSSMYANHPIQIPPEFPKILKQYTKAAIRTQPADLLLWSASYFRWQGRGCSTAVWPMTRNQKVVASNPTLLLLSFPTFLHQWSFLNQVPLGGASLTVCCERKKWMHSFARCLGQNRLRLGFNNWYTAGLVEPPLRVSIICYALRILLQQPILVEYTTRQKNLISLGHCSKSGCE